MALLHRIHATGKVSLIFQDNNGNERPTVLCKDLIQALQTSSILR